MHVCLDEFDSTLVSVHALKTNTLHIHTRHYYYNGSDSKESVVECDYSLPPSLDQQTRHYP